MTTITKKELNNELETLKKFGLTEKEIEGYLDYYKKIFKMVKNKNIIINAKGKKHVKKQF